MTTTSLSPAEAATKETSIEVLSVISNSCLSNSAEDITNVLIPAGTEIRNVPSAEVEVPVLEPLGCTDAPTTGEPSFESVTLPVTTLSCASAEREKSRNGNKIA